MNALNSLPTITNLDFVEELYAEYVGAPTSVPLEWRVYFAALGQGEPPDRGFKLAPSFVRRRVLHPSQVAGARAESEAAMLLLQHRVDRLVRAYRERGVGCRSKSSSPGNARQLSLDGR